MGLSPHGITIEEFEEVAVTPRRRDIELEVFALGWAPHWYIAYHERGGITRNELVPAY